MEGSIEEIRSICQSLQESSADLLRLVSVVNLSFARDVFDFETSCEAVVSVLYFTLKWDIVSECGIKSCLQYFKQKWFEDCGGEDLRDLVPLVYDGSRVDGFGSVILLSSHYLNLSMTETDVKEILLWKCSRASPKWLRESISSSLEKTYEALNKILAQSCTESLMHLEFEDGYMKALSLFFDSYKYHMSQNYDCSLRLLASINSKRCGTFLMGMIHLLTGLNLEYFGKKQAALMKYKSAFNCSNKCWISLLLTARIFRQTKCTDAYLETLELLTRISPSAESRDVSFQGMLLHHHLPSEKFFTLRAKWFLASSYMLQQMFLEAKELYCEILRCYPMNKAISNDAARWSFLRASDSLPQLPDFCCVQMEYALSLIWLKEYDEAEATLKDVKEVGDLSLLYCKEVKEDVNMGLLAIVVSVLISVEASYNLGKMDEAMSRCVRLMLELVCVGGISTNIWTKTFILVKSWLYRLLASITSVRGQRENMKHYERLERQCIELWLNDKETYEESVKYSYEMIIDNVIRYLKPDESNGDNCDK